MAAEERARALLEYLLKHRYLMISSVAPTPKVAGQIEHAEKRFLAAFIVNTLASVLIILSRIWGITSPAQILTLGYGDLITLTLAIAGLISLILAWMEYFAIGFTLSIERAVEIKPKDA